MPMQTMDYYQIMGLDKSADQAEIKRAYRKLARKYHPDVSKESDAENKFKELGEAYEVLKDKQKRSNYDQFGTADPQQNFNPHTRTYSFNGGVDINDIKTFITILRIDAIYISNIRFLIITFFYVF